jgi:hypothetical protein
MHFRKKAWMPGLFAVIALVLVACGSDPTATAPPTATVSPTAEVSSQQGSLSDSTVESDYLKEVVRAERSTVAIFQAFGSVFSQTYPVRETLIAALLDGGIGTPFIEKTAILESLDPPEAFREDHQVWLKASREQLRVDTEAADAVEAGDLVRFAVLNGRLNGINAASRIAVSPIFCRNVAVAPQQVAVCTPEDPAFDGEYLTGINDVAKDFLPAFATSSGNLGFRLSLTPDEMSQVMAETAKDSREAFQGLYSMLESVATPEDMKADHKRLQEFFRKTVEIVTEVERLGESGDADGARRELLKLDPAFCDKRTSFESEEFKAAVAMIFIGDANTCGGSPY